MNASIRRRALSAAATVTFSVLGCGGIVAPLDRDDPDATPIATRDAAHHAALACDTPAGTVDETTFACCRDLVVATLGDAAAWRLPDAAAADPDVLACCGALIRHVDQTPADYAKAGAALGPCCDALHNPIGVACTPWGPPMPAEMASTEVA